MASDLDHANEARRAIQDARRWLGGLCAELSDFRDENGWVVNILAELHKAEDAVDTLAIGAERREGGDHADR